MSGARRLMCAVLNPSGTSKAYRPKQITNSSYQPFMADNPNPHPPPTPTPVPTFPNPHPPPTPAPSPT